MKYVAYDKNTGAILGFYDPNLSYSKIPEPYVEISHNDWLNALENPNKYQVNSTTQELELKQAPSAYELLQTAKEHKKQDLAFFYKRDLVKGFLSSASGISYKYSNDALSHAALNSLVLSGNPSDYIGYDNNNNPIIIKHTSKQLQQVLTDLLIAREASMDNYIKKVEAVNAAATIEDINAITY